MRRLPPVCVSLVWVLQEGLARLGSPGDPQGSGCGCQHRELLCLLGLHPSHLLLQHPALLFLLPVGSSEGQE
ncbi:hypothetical protein I79_005153 [Cricetulus griseus]|uniref:Uncharacterized protein n=1 Tax=Cricetulus griseus TaxID=10029 RepID=G3H4F2_CRIGR|nr:hypothetical protein I79_005153 [Cricetulus griseus]